MELTRKQEEGLKIAIKRFQDHEPWTYISGYAGTGKSTLINFIIEALGIDKKYICYIAFTGKAALVLKNKGCPNAMTAHKLLFKTIKTKYGNYIHIPKVSLDEPYKLIVVDEVSMLPQDMWKLLLSHHVPVIALGDPGQLPAIGENNEILQHPHIFLDEIMRQAKESEIIRLTMDIREDKPLSFYHGNEVQIVSNKDVVSGMLIWADQIICATNATRREINAAVRDLVMPYGDFGGPQEGDKVICTHNNWKCINEDEDVLVNGLIGTLDNIRIGYDQNLGTTGMISNLVLPDGHMFYDLNIDYKLLTEGTPLITKRNYRKISQKFHPDLFEYGYCITGWKSQGSEFDNVLVFQEKFPYDKDTQKKFLYTCATRAAKKLIIVKDWR